MDFIGLLLPDEGYDCIMTITDRLGGADIQIVPMRINIMAEELAEQFFNHWYCENGLLLKIISDHDKLFISWFWTALNLLTGVHLKLSMAYYLQTDGASEWSNKTVNQSSHYHVWCNQKGWVRALPKFISI
jgi:hypothetical protein